MGIPYNRVKGPHSGSLGIPSEQFRETVRAALGRQAGPPAEPYSALTEGLSEIEEQAQIVRERIARERPQLLDRLAETAGLRGWNVQRCEGAEEVLDYVTSLARRMGVTSVARSEQPVFDTVPVDSAIAAAGGPLLARSVRGAGQPERSAAAAGGIGHGDHRSRLRHRGRRARWSCCPGRD